MRQIGSIEKQEDAERFSDYLLASGIPNMVEESAGGWAVWVENDDHLDRAGGELKAFQSKPGDSQYTDAARAAEKVRVEQKKKQERLRRHHIDVRTRLGTPKQYARPVTLTLAAISILAAFATRLGGEISPVMEWMLIAQPHLSPEGFVFAVDPLASLKQGQVWRIITPIFLHFGHFGILHLLFNMIWLMDLGSMIETRRSSLFLIGLVLGAAILSNVGQLFWSGPFFGGMSGVVYALFGYVWIKGKYQPHLGMMMHQQTVWIMMAWLFLCMTGVIGNVANTAHVIGLIVGGVVAYVPVAKLRMKKG